VEILLTDTDQSYPNATLFFLKVTLSFYIVLLTIENLEEFCEPDTIYMIGTLKLHTKLRPIIRGV